MKGVHHISRVVEGFCVVKGVIMDDIEFDGVFISNEIFKDEKLSIVEKYYLSIYNQYHENSKITDAIMMKAVSKPTVSRTKQSLKKMGYIKSNNISPKEAKKMVLDNKNKGFICEWCGTKTYAIQKHHYPISQKDGGEQTVNICPNCHFEYHLITKGQE